LGDARHNLARNLHLSLVEYHGGYAMRFYLGVWKSATAISDDEAAAQYLALSDEQSVESEFDDQVYAFYSRLTRQYPEVEMVAEDELDACPWACGLDVAGDHVIMAIQPEMSEKVIPLVRVLAAQYELVCFDPQVGKVHLPARLRAQQDAAATGFRVAASGHPTQCRTRERAAENLYSPTLAAAFSRNSGPSRIYRGTMAELLSQVWFIIGRSLASVIAAVARPTRSECPE
jgi:hypothetical protein